MRSGFKILHTAVGVFLATILVGQNNLTLNIVSDQYRSEISWELLNSSNVIVAFGEDYGSNYPDDGEYPLAPIDINDLPNDEYSLKWFDSANDGLCCTYGFGYFSLVENENDIEIFNETQAGTYSFTLPYTLPPISPSPLSISLELFAQGFTNPVDIKSTNDERLFVVEQLGKIKIINADGTVNATSFLDITDRTSNDGGERGLLGLAFHPNYQENGFFYVNYIKEEDGNTRIARFSVSPDDANIGDPETEFVIYEAEQPYSNHNGGEVQFGPDGFLYIGLGDGGSADDPEERAQDLTSPMGKMLRINVDGVEPFEIPADNPFVGQENVLPEIWAYGLRNPWRYSFDSENGDLWIGDVGQSQWEEVDYFQAGSTSGVNYGWDCYEGYENFEEQNCDGGEVVQYPIHVYPHTDGVSITGGVVYRSNEFPNLYGKYIYADYGFGNIWAITKESDNTFTNQIVKPSAGILPSVFGEDINKTLYVADYAGGKIYKITDACPLNNPFIDFNDGYIISSDAVNYYWFLNGQQLDSTTNAQILIPTEVGTYYVIVQYEGGCLQQSETIDITTIGLAENNNKYGINIFPNPAKNYINITSKTSIDKVINLEIVDVLGKKVGQWKINNLAAQNQFDIGSIVSGIYNLNIYDDSKNLINHQKFIIAK
jgi:glucose/arabinose dehydrogenase